MDKKKALKIGGITLLSILGTILGILFIVIPLAKTLYLNSFSHGIIDNYNESSMAGEDSSFLATPSASKSVNSIREYDTIGETVPTSISENDKNIIKQGDLRMLADDIDKTVKEVETIAKSFNAESQNTYDSGKGKYRSVSMVYKVNVGDFENFFGKLKAMDVDFDSSSSGITDVTNEVIDLQARLRTYKNTEEQLLQIQKEAKSVTDTMAVYKELTDIRYKIESVESQLKYYSNQTEYSTVTIEVAQNNAGAMIEDDKWKPLGVVKNALRAFVAVLKALGSLMIWVVVFGTPVVLIVLLVRYIVRKYKR